MLESLKITQWIMALGSFCKASSATYRIGLFYSEPPLYWRRMDSLQIHHPINGCNSTDRVREQALPCHLKRG